MLRIPFGYRSPLFQAASPSAGILQLASFGPGGSCRAGSQIGVPGRSDMKARDTPARSRVVPVRVPRPCLPLTGFSFADEFVRRVAFSSPLKYRKRRATENLSSFGKKNRSGEKPKSRRRAPSRLPRFLRLPSDLSPWLCPAFNERGYVAWPCFVTPFASTATAAWNGSYYRCQGKFGRNRRTPQAVGKFSCCYSSHLI